MEKRGQIIWVVVVAVLLIISTLVILSGFFGSNTSPNTNSNNTEDTNNMTIPQTNTTANTSTTANTTMNAPGNTTSNTTLQNNTSSDLIPNPIGTLTAISRIDNSAEYFCDNDESPKHGARVYSYKIINGVKNLSAKYIESKKIEVCEDYNNETVTAGINYNIEWTWSAVEGVDGYKIYQYYENENISREYDYVADVKTNKLFDTKLDLWTKN